MIAKRTDSNQTAIVEALRAAGAFVQSLAMVGVGTPDLMALHGGRIVLIEVKDGSQPPSARALTPAEARWHKAAERVGVKVHTATSAEEAVAAISGGCK